MADAADTETVGNRQLAGINDISALAQFVVEDLKNKVLISRSMKSHDNRRLQMIRQQGPETHLAHAVHQCVAILPITRAAPGQTALPLILIQRLFKSQHRVRRRRKTPLTVILQCLPLIIQIQAQ